MTIYVDKQGVFKSTGVKMNLFLRVLGERIVEGHSRDIGIVINILIDHLDYTVCLQKILQSKQL